MERNPVRNALTERLQVENLKYDIRVLITELNYHQSKIRLFGEAIKAQKNDLNKILEGQKSQLPMNGVYQ